MKCDKKQNRNPGRNWRFRWCPASTARTIRSFSDEVYQTCSKARLQQVEYFLVEVLLGPWHGIWWQIRSPDFKWIELNCFLSGVCWAPPFKKYEKRENRVWGVSSFTFGESENCNPNSSWRFWWCPGSTTRTIPSFSDEVDQKHDASRFVRVHVHNTAILKPYTGIYCHSMAIICTAICNIEACMAIYNHNIAIYAQNVTNWSHI